jgi:hypothetical protein
MDGQDNNQRSEGEGQQHRPRDKRRRFQSRSMPKRNSGVIVGQKVGSKTETLTGSHDEDRESQPSKEEERR